MATLPPPPEQVIINQPPSSWHVAHESLIINFQQTSLATNFPKLDQPCWTSELLEKQQWVAQD